MIETPEEGVPDDDLPSLDVRARLERIYEGLESGHDTPAAERAHLEATAGSGTAAYGEITPNAAARLLGWLAPTEPDVFLDLGSGAGRLVVQAVLTTGVRRAVGIELSDHRHAIAERARARLEPAEAARLELVPGDMRTASYRDATLAYAGSTTFPDELMLAVAVRLRELPRLRACITTRPFPPGSPLRESARLPLDMSWMADVRCYVYR